MSFVYVMSDIHGCLAEFEKTLFLAEEHLEEDDVWLVLLGDYIHGGEGSRGVLDRIMELQYRYGYGSDKAIALMGNHEEMAPSGESSIDSISRTLDDGDDNGDDGKYLSWMGNLPRYYTEGNTIFVHAGINEETGDLWEYGTGDEIFTGKFPAETGQIADLDMKVVAGHVGTSAIAGETFTATAQATII